MSEHFEKMMKMAYLPTETGLNETENEILASSINTTVPQLKKNKDNIHIFRGKGLTSDEAIHAQKNDVLYAESTTSEVYLSGKLADKLSKANVEKRVKRTPSKSKTNEIEM